MTVGGLFWVLYGVALIALIVFLKEIL